MIQKIDWIRLIGVHAGRWSARMHYGPEGRKAIEKAATRILKERPFEPGNENFTDAEDYRRFMVPSVVQAVALAMLQRPACEELARGENDMTSFQLTEAAIAADVRDDMIRSIEIWIARRKESWCDELVWARENGRRACQTERMASAKIDAERAARLKILSESEPRHIAVPVLWDIFDIPTAEIANVRRIRIAEVHRINTRYRRGVEAQAELEFRGFRAVE
jgi:hypothetical protein